MLIENCISRVTDIAEKVARLLISEPANSPIRGEEITPLLRISQARQQLTNPKVTGFTEVFSGLVHESAPGSRPPVRTYQRFLNLTLGSRHQYGPHSLNRPQTHPGARCRREY